MSAIQRYAMKDCGKRSPIGSYVLYSDHQERVRVLREALGRVRYGVLLMVPEPQKSGFLKIVDEALETPND